MYCVLILALGVCPPHPDNCNDALLACCALFACLVITIVSSSSGPYSYLCTAFHLLTFHI